MKFRSYCLHFVRRCFLTRTSLTVFLAVVICLALNYYLSIVICSRCLSNCRGVLRSADVPDETIDNLKNLKYAIENDISLQEKYLGELHRKISVLRSKVFSLQQDKLNEESRIRDLQQNIKRHEDKLTAVLSQRTPEVLPPLSLSGHFSSRPNEALISIVNSSTQCSMLNCFNFARCSLFSSLIYFRYKANREVGRYASSTESTDACVFIYEASNTDDVLPDKLIHLSITSSLNHIVIVNGAINAVDLRKFPVSVIFGAVGFLSEPRRGFDIVVPYFSTCFEEKLPPVWPVKRKSLYVFVDLDDKHVTELAKRTVGYLNTAKPVSEDVLTYLRLDPVNLVQNDCDDFQLRGTKFGEATFSVLLYEYHHHTEANILLIEILLTGSVPVVLYSSELLLPLADIIDWHRIAVLLPSYRVSEMYYLLKSLSVADVAGYKLSGRAVVQQFFISPDSGLLGVLATMTRRLQLPFPSLADFAATSVYSSRFAPTAPMQPVPFAEDGIEISLDDNLGPLELPHPSDTFSNNFTYSLSRANDAFHHTYMAPNAPFLQLPFIHDVIFKPKELSLDFRLVGQGFGGSGRELGLALGGNLPAEQFTVVLLTRGGDRLSVLIDIISRFKQLPYLNKVVVIWNSPDSPPPLALKWPELVVPIFVAKMANNSLNNRFLPFSEIETDAVLSLDDDIFLRPDEIVFAFRIWRENRDRIVGFPSRGHGWNASNERWIYLSDYSCEYSLILTGAAFVHKYYFYLYTHLMPAPIRATVDNLMNCEDIAMNFMVSHLTRHPPLKVTVRWTFHCPYCSTTLSREQEHYTERSNCINFFSEVYGYNPLLYSQLRADSVLFKTRIPSSHQKCFKYV